MTYIEKISKPVLILDEELFLKFFGLFLLKPQNKRANYLGGLILT